MSANLETQPTLVVRNAAIADIDEIIALATRVYADMPPYSPDILRGHINNFPEGVFVAVYDGRVVGYCATFIVDGELALGPHTWKEITGGGYASRHDPEGDYLYGMEVFVDPSRRGLRIGKRLYDERKKLCRFLRLKGIVFAGRIPGYRRRAARVGSPERYVELVKDRKLRDPVLSFQLRNGFEVLGVLKNYLPIDRDSHGCGVHMIWRNPEVSDDSFAPRAGAVPRSSSVVRIAAVQFMQRRVASFEEFAHDVRYFVDVVADYRTDFVVFPELFTLQLLSLEPRRLNPIEAIERLTSYTDRFKEFMRDLAVRFNVNIIGGSHPTMVDSGDVQNISYVFLRDGSIHQQVKLHPTPNEKRWWNIKGGTELNPIPTDCGLIGVLICYDSEFPETARHLVNQGVRILFVPFCTDERQSFMRVRYCAHARAVENQIYVVMAGNIGNLPNVENMDIQYAQSCILTPCDFPFARDGIAADTTPNVEMIAVADLNLDTLSVARNDGTVQNLRDRRFDLYEVRWKL
ncbi:MAG: GNAT family N-acetyltransferase [Gammaproteobacteria bacterium]|nr:GNAT family N-acetyltransferase [Gammaproteobacteria bacterium]